MSGSDYEREMVRLLEQEYGWLAVRSAGSMGKGDVVAVKPGHPNSPAVLEIKKISDDVFYVSDGGDKGKQQWWMMVQHAQCGINSMYAVRHTTGKRDNRWQIHWLDGGEDEIGKLRRGEGKTLTDCFG